MDYLAIVLLLSLPFLLSLLLSELFAVPSSISLFLLSSFPFFFLLCFSSSSAFFFSCFSLIMSRNSLLVSTLVVVTAQVVDLLDCLEVNGDTNFCRIFEWFYDASLFLFAGTVAGQETLQMM